MKRLRSGAILAGPRRLDRRNTWEIPATPGIRVGTCLAHIPNESVYVLSLHNHPVGRPASGRERGFSLVELTVVVVIIAALAVVAIPQITRRMKDRRTQQAAQEVANLYRGGRMRAMGRGAAVLVRYSSNAQGRVSVSEAVQSTTAGGATTAGACQMLPVSSCNLVTWTAADSQLITYFDPAQGPNYEGVTVTVTGAPPDDASQQSDMDVCFSPMGRTFVRYSTTGAWSPLTGVPVITVRRQTTSGQSIGLTRTVLLLPNGTARLATARSDAT
jgi:prepilin-type N-terminal cleavage/methylation domain-containing protein